MSLAVARRQGRSLVGSWTKCSRHTPLKGQEGCPSMPDTWQLLAAASFLTALGVYAWRRWGMPGAVSFAIACLFGVLWLTGATVSAAAQNVQVKIGAHEFQALWRLPMVTAMLCFGLEYALPAHRLTRRQLVLLSMPALLAMLLVLTNGLHQLVWTGFVFDARGAVVPQLGSAGWLLTVYGWSLLPVNILLFCWLFVRSPIHRWPAALIVAGMILAAGLYITCFAGLNVIPGVHPFVALLVAPFALFAVALFGFRIFDPVPAAHRTAIDQMREGMIVFDAKWRVVNLNPAAERILGSPSRLVRGHTIQEVLPSFPSLGVADSGADADCGVVALRTRQGVREYAPRLSSLHEYQGTVIGHVLLLLDVTESRREQARIVEEQRTQAMVQERERLAQELHDSVGQVFATVSVMGQAIRGLLAKGDIARADEHIARLVEISDEADKDIRDSILGLRVAFSSEGFFNALARYLYRYEKNYGIGAELVRAEILQEGAFNSSVEIQLLRIVQEALTNVRKHSGATSVQVVFGTEDGCARVVVQDDGKGFDAREQNPRSDHVGLRVMRERAQSVGGTMAVQSSPGEGTQVIVTVPLSKASALRGGRGS